LWLIITCTGSRVTTAALLSIHTASRVSMVCTGCGGHRGAQL